MKTELVLMADIPVLAQTGRKLHLSANPAERKKLAERIEVPEVKHLEVDFKAEKEAAGIYLLRGHIKAKLVQTCVRTLQPVSTGIDEAFEVTFMDEGIYAEQEQAEEETEIEDIEVLTGEEVNLGEIAAQYLSLFVDPFPVGEDEIEEKALKGKATLSDEESHRQESSVFAVLKKLDNKT